MDILIGNLKPALRAQVVATIPKTLEQVIENAIYLEERAVGVVTDRLKLWDQQHKCNSSDPIEQSTTEADRIHPRRHSGCQDARASCRSSAARGNGAGPTPARALRTGPPAQPNHQLSPLWQDLTKHLQSFGRAPATRSGTRNPATKRPAEPLSEQPPNARPFVLPRPAPTDNGPTPMESTFETEALYNAEQCDHTNAVVEAEVKILGKAFERITDTCASDTVLSHSLVCHLGLMDQLLPSRASFLTAAGKTERPMGMLPNLPITIGSLCLHVDCMVTKADN
ncbi:TPA: hypothetical protein ACH3X2_002337 [Trebouxia sp. C0005]